MLKRILYTAVFGMCAGFLFGCSGEASSGGSGCDIVTADGGSIAIECDDGTSASVPNGADGADGQDGQPGADGAGGNPGGDGADGADGNPGADGQDGDDGSAGTDGADGTDGQPGNDGNSGVDGQDGTECTTTQNADGTSSITCPDGTSEDWWSGYSGRVFYRADADIYGYEGVYVARIEGGASTSLKLNQTPVEFGEVWTYWVSADGNTLVYGGDLETDGLVELYYVDLSGDTPTAPVKISGTLPGTAGMEDVSLSANGETVVYTIDIDIDGYNELYYVDLSGASPTAPVKISGTMVSGGTIASKPLIPISDDGNRVLYVADQETDGVYELYYVDLSGPSPAAPVKISGTLVTDGDVATGVNDILLSANGQAAVFTADKDTDGVVELYYVDLSGVSPAAPVKISAAMTATNVVYESRISANAETVLYSADQETDGVEELYYVDLSGVSPAAAVKLNDTLPLNSDIDDYQISADGQTALFYGDMDVYGTYELYYVDLSGVSPTAPAKISGEMVTDGYVHSDWMLSADGQGVVYRADQYIDIDNEAFYVGMNDDDPTPNVRLHEAVETGTRDVDNVAISADGQTVAFAGDLHTTDVRQLYLVSIMGNGQPTTPLLINAPMVTDGMVTAPIEIRPL